MVFEMIEQLIFRDHKKRQNFQKIYYFKEFM